jgi:hypothetical protein
METMAPASLKKKPASELWSIRKRIITELQTLANNAEGRAYTLDEEAFEQRASSNIEAIDAVIEENFRDQAMSRYNGIGSQSLSQRDMDLDAWAREALQGKRPGEFILQPEERGSTISQPGLEYRSQWEQRDTLTSTATQALPVSVYPRFVMHLVEQTPVLRAGAMLIQTETGEDLKVPKDPKEISQEIRRDVIDPALNGIERRLNAARSALLRKGAVSVGVGALATTCGLLTANPLLIGSGFATAMTTVAHVNKYIEEDRDVSLSDMYFLWRAQKHAKELAWRH